MFLSSMGISSSVFRMMLGRIYHFHGKASELVKFGGNFWRGDIYTLLNNAVRHNILILMMMMNNENHNNDEAQ